VRSKTERLQNAFFQWAGKTVVRCDEDRLVLRDRRGRRETYVARPDVPSFAAAQRHGLDGIFRRGVFYEWRP
jgi:hypothetical protein